MDRGFEFLDHTADVGIKVWGRNWKEILKAAAEGMLSIIVDLKCVQVKESITLEIKADSKEELLFNWLREILFQFEKRGMLFSQVDIKDVNFSNREKKWYRVSGVLGGEKINLSRHDICTEIKAVTHHGFYFHQRGSLWEAVVLFDV